MGVGSGGSADGRHDGEDREEVRGLPSRSEARRGESPEARGVLLFLPFTGDGQAAGQVRRVLLWLVRWRSCPHPYNVSRMYDFVRLQSK